MRVLVFTSYDNLIRMVTILLLGVTYLTLRSISGLKLQYSKQRGSKNVSLKLEENICELSFDQGKLLKRQTLTNHLSPEYWGLISKNTFYYCPNPECPVIYFNSKISAYFTQHEVNTQVMHKLPVGFPNRIACYCMVVLESVILEELIEKQCCETLKDIQKYTKANTGKDCAITNPTGKCCGSEIKKIIDWAKHREGIRKESVEEAIDCCTNIEKNTGLNVRLNSQKD